MFTTINWHHLGTALRRIPLLQGIFRSCYEVSRLDFITPSGDRITVPEGSTLEIHFRSQEDAEIPF